ncbi:hypothetical protein [Rugosimonospora africana]|uniref:Uncharacterized protein n=1 Tax=Rugosimonospora africana TaxID=556532 RepID=A0A8J3VVF4_9ACTN|nr:hypothetical protein [Rugosimonospora africana]GIH20592.1 hypothetical protein Raf01_87640 [Rugosimonospora africana]
MSEETIRAILRDIAEEAVPVDLTDKAMSGAVRRRAILLGTGAAAVVALALGVTPLALASINPPQNGAPARPTSASTGPGPSTSPAPSQSWPGPGQSQPAPGQSFRAPGPSTSPVPTAGHSEQAPGPSTSPVPTAGHSEQAPGPSTSPVPIPGHSEKAH